MKDSVRHGDLVRDFKKFTSKEIVQSNINNRTESRRDWMLERFLIAGQQRSNTKNYQFWQQDNHPIEVYTPSVIAQKLDYFHLNPVKAGIVEETHQYIYSSASNYQTGKGLINVEILEFPMSMVGYVRMD